MVWQHYSKLGVLGGKGKRGQETLGWERRTFTSPGSVVQGVWR